MSGDKRLSKVLMLGAASLPLLMAGAAMAQSTTGSKLEEVVVTAGRMAVPITEVPQTVSIVTREEMDIRGVQDLNQALSYSSGIRFRDYPGQQGMAEFFMRGFRVNNTAGSVFRDGLRAQFNGLDGDIEAYGLERVELLKGPASVLYGQVAPGGLVNVFSKRPTRDPIGEVLLQGGSFKRKQVAADVGGPITQDGQFQYRLTGLLRDSDTQFDYVKDDRRYFAPALTWAPTERTKITLLGQYTMSRTSGSDQSFPTSGTMFANANGVISSSRFLGEPAANKYEVHTGGIGYDLAVNLADGLDLGQTLRYTRSALDLIAVQVANSAVLNAGGRTLNRIALDRDARSRSFLTDGHLSWKSSFGEVESILLGGVDYAWFRRLNLQRNGTVAPIDVFTPTYGAPITWAATLASNLKQGVEQTGVYGQAQFKWGGLSLTGGLRKDWVETLTQNNLTGVTTLAKTDAITGRGGVIYEFDFGLAPYFSYSTSFQPLAGATFAGTPFDPTTGRQYEAGVRYEPVRGILLTGALYNLAQQNINTPDIAHPGFFVQQGEVTSKGAELEVEADFDGTKVQLAYTHTFAVVTKANPNAAGVSTKDLNQLAVPLNTVSAWATHGFDVGPGVLTVGGGVRAIAGSYNPENTLKTKPYALVDALVDYKLGGWSLAVNVNNLFDKTYFTPGFYTQSVFFGFERNVRATLKYHW